MSVKIFQFDVPELCALPLVRRCYQALVAALAVFILTLVVWREPFRGYLAEVHLSGPQAEGIDLALAANWIKQTDKRVAVVATAAGEISTKPQIRATYLAASPRSAAEHLDGLAERFLFQYLPDRLQNYRHVALAELRNTAQAAREREDAARWALENLRQKQLALVLKTAGEAVVTKAVEAAGVAKEGPIVLNNPGKSGIHAGGMQRGANTSGSPIEPTPSPSVAAAGGAGPKSSPSNSDLSEARTKALDRLHLLRLELASLLANCTDQHPDVITLRSQIAMIERELGIDMNSREVSKPVQVFKLVSGETTNPPINSSESGQTVALALSQGDSERLASVESSAVLPHVDESAEILKELARAGRERQAAERRLAERMQELTNQPAAAQWSAAPAHLVTRMGGTPRTPTLGLAFLLAGVAGVVIFRSAGEDGCVVRIDSAGLLASTLELPVVGNLVAIRDSARQLRRKWLTAARLNWILYGSEIVIGVAVMACLGSIAVEPSLARQVLADPFGTLSEVMGRIGS